MCLALIVVHSMLPVQGLPVAIEFEPESATEAFIKASAEYDAIWKAEGTRTIEAMERVTGITFEERRIKAIVYEGVSFSGGGERPMRLRASYPPDVKKATLVHELLHRMLSRVKPTNEIDEHRKLFLVLYDIWVGTVRKGFRGSERGRRVTPKGSLRLRVGVEVGADDECGGARVEVQGAAGGGSIASNADAPRRNHANRKTSCHFP